jgi:hypothetical protein
MWSGPESSRSNRSGGWGTPPKPKVFDNSPDRAKGMKAFLFDKHGQPDQGNPDPEYIIHAGTLKAARKKLVLLVKSNRYKAPTQ